MVVNPLWAPLGAARFLKMVDSGFYDRIATYRVVPGFIVQFGIPYTPASPQAWPQIKDDPNVGVQCPVFKRGMLAFAGYAANTRTTQVFISFEDDPNLGTNAWDNPFGIVTSGMDVVDRLYSGYGDLSAFGGRAPDPTRMQNQGGAFLRSEFPLMDYFTSCSRLPQAPVMPVKGKGMARPASCNGANPNAAAPAGPLPRCSKDFCGSGIGYTGAAVCLCHENCLFPGSDLPCCLGFAEVCPAEYARGPAAPASPAIPASPAFPAIPASPTFPAIPASPAFPAIPAAKAKAKRGKRVAKKAVIG